MNDARFLRIAAIASVLSAVTTLCLIFLPELYQPADDFAGRMARVHDPAYRVRAWAYLVHPFLTMTAAAAMAALAYRRAPVLAIAGALGFALWGSTEAAQQTLTLFAFDPWRVAYATADAAVRETIRINTAMYDGLWNAMYLLVLIAFSIGNACLGAALLGEPGRLGRIVGGFMLAAVALTLVLLIGELGVTLLPERVTWWSYPVVQPLGRVLIGVWLWSMAAKAAAPQRPSFPRDAPP